MERKTIIKLLAAILVIAGLIALYQLTPVKQYLTEDGIRSLIEPFGMFAPVAFMILYVVAVVLLVPASLFTIVAGTLFGLWAGLAYVLIAATLAAAIGFIIARKFADKFEVTNENQLVKKMKETIEKQLDENGIQTFLILRFLYLPYMALSYAAGLVKKAKLRDFIIATFLGNVTGSFTFVFLGSQLTNGWKALILPVILIILTLFIPKAIKKFTKHDVN